MSRRGGLFSRRKRMMEDLDQDIRDYLERETQDNIERGMSPEKARYAALRKFGNVTRVREETRDVWSFVWLEQLWQDIRFGSRMLAKNPGFTSLAVMTLALGIGANTAIFSVLNGVLLRPLPYPHPDRLVWVWPANLHTGQSRAGAISPPDFEDYRKRSTVFEHLAAFLPLDYTLTGNGEAERVTSAAVSSSFFETFDVQPSLGRTILPTDEQVAWPQVVVLSYGLWQSRFNGDPKVLGKTLTVDGKGMTVVGVMPAGFAFPARAQLWNPLPFKYDEMKARRMHFLRVVGRLKADVNLERSQAQMKSIALTLEKLYPDSNTDAGVQPVNLRDQMVGDMRLTLQVLMIAVSFVLMIACANVGGLLVARSGARQKEVAIRRSLGAGLPRVTRQLLTESILLALAGGGVGVLLAMGSLKVLLALNPANIPRLDQVHLDPAALAFTVAVSIVTGLAFGLVPATRTSKVALTETLKEGSRGVSPGRSHHRFHGVLVGTEVAASLVLLVGAGLMIRTFNRLESVKPGFNPTGVLTLRISLPIQGVTLGSPYSGNVFFAQLLDHLRALPGVEFAALTSDLPLSGQENDTWFTIEGRPPVVPGHRPDEDARVISTDYFRAMGIPLAAGRYFTDADDLKAGRVAIVNRKFALKYFPGQDPLGQHLNIDFGINFRAEIVGVVGDTSHRSLMGAPAPTLYVPYTQRAFARTNVVIRSQTPRLLLLAEVRHEVQTLNREIPVYDFRTMDEVVVGDATRIRQIIINLVDNAVKFTHRGEIVVGVKPESRDGKSVLLHFFVSDTGIGIPADKQTVIFEAFSQVDATTTRRYGGTGLGLTICSRLVDMMQGQIWVESEVGKGSTFHSTARVGQVQRPAGPAPPEPVSLEGVSVLVVDDSATNRRLLEGMLTRWGMKTTLTEGVQAALAALQQAQDAGHPFPLVVTDTHMPELDGFQLAETLRREPKWPQSTVVMLTSAGQRGDAAHCRELGIAAYLTKPIRQSQLRETLVRSLAARSLRAGPLELVTCHSLREHRQAGVKPRQVPLRILVAEDNPANQRLAQRLLDKRGHAVVVVTNGHEALAALAEQRFDLVLMDVHMPDMDGLEATAAIRAREKSTGEHLRIIAMTALAMKGDQERCLAAGMVGYLCKPICAQELIEVLEAGSQESDVKS